MVSAVFPSVAIIILSLAMPAEYHDDTGRGAGLSIERGSAEAKPDEKTLVSSHLAFQRALTYGRLGEAVWGESDFSDAFRYESVDGRIRRASATGRAGRDDDGSHDSGDLAFVLAEPQLLGISRR
jgi:hypothetical protein